MLESPAGSEKREEIRTICDTYCVFVVSKRGSHFEDRVYFLNLKIKI